MERKKAINSYYKEELKLVIKEIIHGKNRCSYFFVILLGGNQLTQAKNYTEEDDARVER